MHEESLKLFLKKAHSLVSITEYARNSSKYEKTFCPEHRNIKHKFVRNANKYSAFIAL